MKRANTGWIKDSGCLLWLLLASMFLQQNDARAQALGLGTGWYSGVSSENLNLQPDSIATLNLSRRIPLLLEFYSRGFFDEQVAARFGLRLHIYGASSRVDSLQENSSAGETRSYSMTSILLSYQHRLSEPGQGYFIFDLAGGFSIYSSGEASERRFSLVPGVSQIFRISSGVGVQAGLRLHLIFGDSQEIAPFKSGLLLSVGIAMEG